MKALTKTQIVLTILVVIAFVAEMMMARWIHSMAYFDPVRRQLEHWLDLVSFVLWFGAVGSWLLFSVFHLVVLAVRKAKAKS